MGDVYDGSFLTQAHRKMRTALTSALLSSIRCGWCLISVSVFFRGMYSSRCFSGFVRFSGMVMRSPDLLSSAVTAKRRSFTRTAYSLSATDLLFSRRILIFSYSSRHEATRGADTAERSISKRPQNMLLAFLRQCFQCGCAY